MRKMLLFALAILVGSIAMGQTRSVTGKVTDSKGSPIPSASVMIKGTKNGTSTDANGVFKISAKTGATLAISAVNYKPLEVRVGSENTINVTLADYVSNLDEVVVTAGGITTKRKEQGYTATTIKANELTAAKPTNLAGGLAGKVAGLEVSATGGGVNPSYRLVLRGLRSLLGNNQALIVLDNVIVPSSVLGNLNPEDISDITVLNGANAVALYGSDASNGALIVTSKKGRRGHNEIKISNTTTVEQVAFFPKHQTKFGQGGSSYGIDPNGNPIYSPRENQSYGPAFDGSLRNLGDPLEDGSVYQTTYAAKDDWKKFWANGLTNQTDFSISTGDERSTMFFSAQYVNTTGTTPKDTYNRASFRLGGTRSFSPKISTAYTISYVQNRYDQLSSGTFATMYDNLNNIAGNVPITQFQDWRNNKFANPNGYFNPWYANPYFNIDNYRTKTRNDYIIGSVDLKYEPFKWLNFTLRTGITTQNQTSQSTVGVFTYTDYALRTNASIGGTKSNIVGSDAESSAYSTQLTSDFIVGVNKKVKDFTFDLLVSAGLRQNMSDSLSASVSGLVVPGLYNLSNSLNAPSTSNSYGTTRRLDVYGDFKVGFRNYLFLHLTGRNDWVSVLNPSNYSFFYPAADISFIATDAIPALKNIKGLDYLKLRGGISKVGNVNVGAYGLNTTFGQTNGYPFSGAGGFTVGNRVVDPNIRPEFTVGTEAGIDFSLFKNYVDASVTWYQTNTTAQTVPVSISWATGYSSYLFNTGETKNVGVESRLAVTPIRRKDWTVTVGGNYTYNNNTVLSINSALPQLAIATYGSGAGAYAVPGMVFPVIMGNDYVRDPQGRVVVDGVTGRPSLDKTLRVLGNAATKDKLALDLTVRYKQFRLYTLFEYRGGNQVYQTLGRSLDWSGVGYRTAVYDRKPFVFPNSVIADPAHPGSYIPNTSVVVNNANDGFWADNDGTYNRGISSNYVTNGSFWKLRQVSISYDVPTSVLRKTKAIKGATISVQGRNLFLWLPKSNLYTDPEYSDAGSDSNGIGLTGMSTSPPSRFYGATITLIF
ncbi:MAG: SusC/RagA family TonB-linked outer membrane protein [Bacteroidetes bacterium]|nr:SusC/RagA family TonB-linked outer membrane protein [Bacteroidota bacterium]